MKIFDSLSGQKKPLSSNNPLKIYACGPTVYNYIHIGNARPVVMTDVLVRFLRTQDLDVKYLMNITDIDDKIIAKATQEKQSELEVASRYTDAFKEDIDALNVVRPDNMISVSAKINNIIDFIDDIEKTGAAYIVDGDVYFDVMKFQDEYTKLSHQNLADLRDGVRIENSHKKKNNLDFTLWKKTVKGKQFLTKWSSGRPGWHTECVALIDNFFNSPVDIHIGGIDLRFPHHENERIQYLAKTGVELASTWMHIGHVMLQNQKMAKSVGNIILVRDFLQTRSANDLRYIFLQTKYTQPINITDVLLDQATKWNERVTMLLKKVNWMIALNDLSVTDEEPISDDFDSLAFKTKFIAAMEDDLNTADAISVLDELQKYINNKIKTKVLDKSFEEFIWILKTLGFNYDIKDLTLSDVSYIQEWKRLVNEQEFKDADKLRDDLIKRGIF